MATTNTSGLSSLFRGTSEGARASEHTMPSISSSTREQEGFESSLQPFGGYFSALLPQGLFGNNYRRVSSRTQSEQNPSSETGQTTGSHRFGLGSSQDS